MPKKFYITTPIYYVNASPHIGHTYTTVAADILARYHRMIGEKVFFLTGTDEHGAKIEEKALEAGKEPKEFADEVAASFQFAWDELNISNDRFIRTTEKAHIKAVQNALQIMYDKGDIYLGTYEGLYCQGCEQYLHEKDLVGGLCPDHKTKPKKMKEKSYMFKLSKYQDKIYKKIKSDEFLISPAERKNEVLSFFEKEGLNDISFSRKNVKWGIPLPWDKSHTAYVWADAFLNYLTGLGWDGNETKSDFGYPKSDFRTMWPADLHLMSKDILRVHATIWPAMLLSLGIKLPKTLFIHGFFMIDGQKMSKSLGNVITPNDLVKKYGVDGARYLVASAAPFGSDGDISWTKFDEKYNADLANGIGNLVARSVTLAEKNQKSKIKNQNDKSKLKIKESWGVYKNNLIGFKIDKAIEVINGEIKFLDNYITTEKPWELIKKKDEKVGAIMYNILERLRHIAWMLWPFMPETAEKIYNALGLDLIKEMQAKGFKFENATKWGGLPVNTKVRKGEILFPRLN
jgi:methionyl-tRNA synthetase